TADPATTSRPFRRRTARRSATTTAACPTGTRTARPIPTAARRPGTPRSATETSAPIVATANPATPPTPAATTAHVWASFVRHQKAQPAATVQTASPTTAPRLA